MNLWGRLDAMPLFWKACLLVAALLAGVVGLVEALLEPVAKQALERLYGGFHPWHEAAIWLLTLLVCSLICGYVLAKMLSAKLESMEKVSRALAQGNLNVRLPVTGNDGDAFDSLARNFNAMADTVVRWLFYERRLLADISHELRSPLARMMLAAELLRRGREEADDAAVVLRLGKDLTHMSELVASLLEQARDRLSVPIVEPVNISLLLDDLVEEYVFQADVEKKTIQVKAARHLAFQGDPALLRRMIANLLANAVFYTPPGGKVDVIAGWEGEAVVVAVRDYGPGVPEEQLGDIFRVFYRVDSSRTRSSGGVGLGLALAREAATLHGGSIWACNAGPGLRVTVRLPACGMSPGAEKRENGAEA